MVSMIYNVNVLMRTRETLYDGVIKIKCRDE